ncbi:MAG: hypothetical protein ACPGTU_11085 [Myxococcota bacterium]
MAHLLKVAPVRRMPEVAIPEDVEVRAQIVKMTVAEARREAVMTVAEARREVGIIVAEARRKVGITVVVLASHALVAEMGHGNRIIFLGWIRICPSRQTGGWDEEKLFLRAVENRCWCGEEFQVKLES